MFAWVATQRVLLAMAIFRYNSNSTRALGDRARKRDGCNLVIRAPLDGQGCEHLRFCVIVVRAHKAAPKNVQESLIILQDLAPLWSVSHFPADRLASTTW
jgi:hypothetical protein